MPSSLVSRGSASRRQIHALNTFGSRTRCRTRVRSPPTRPFSYSVYRKLYRKFFWDTTCSNRASPTHPHASTQLLLRITFIPVTLWSERSDWSQFLLHILSCKCFSISLHITILYTRSVYCVLVKIIFYTCINFICSTESDASTPFPSRRLLV